MVNINEVHLGNWVLAEIDGKHTAGKVERKSVEKIGVKINEELGWFLPKDIYPILLTEDWLKKLDFIKEEGSDGAVHYKHGRFTLTYPDKNNSKRAVLDCPGVHPRQLEEVPYVHILQNHYHEMTKVYVE